MPTFKLTLAYDGTSFVGWQRQATGTSIQGLLEDALRDLDGRDVSVAGASRTDAGVHALGQVAGVSLERSIDAASLVGALNARLPESVRVLDAAGASPDFHARFDARAKLYRYRLWIGETLLPFERAYSWHLPAPRLDLEAMASAATLFEGRHDFAAFQASGANRRTTERTVRSVRVTSGASPWTGGSLVIVEVCGEGFLRHMVRTMVGTLVDVGRGHRPPHWVESVLASRDRAQAGPTAPPAGLFLVSVDYE
jgi:tRNA pseudouridine38-40 synthase